MTTCHTGLEKEHAGSPRDNDEPSPGLVSSAIQAITQHIRSQGLGPGDLLPSEAAMTRQLNVSRTIVREAFRSLSAMRLIDMSAGRRATVAKLDTGAMSMVIEHGITTQQISVQQVYDVRRTIEMRTVALAALRRTEVEAGEIARLARLMRENLKVPDLVMEHDIAFHEAIAAASHNPVLLVDRHGLQRRDAAHLGDRLADAVLRRCPTQDDQGARGYCGGHRQGRSAACGRAHGGTFRQERQGACRCGDRLR